MGIFSKFNKGLKKTRDSFLSAFNDMIHSFTKVDEDLLEELEEILVMSDVGMDTAQFICSELRAAIKRDGITDPAVVKEYLKRIICEMISGDEELHLNTKPSVLLVIGVNGTGKTTSIGKMAHMFKEQGKSVLLGAADTFRAAAIEQLEVWADRAGVPLIKNKEGSDPAAVVFDTVAAGKSRNADLIICDTAGRLHNKKNLMDELSKINRIIDRELPDSDKEVLLVVDATTGQNAVNQAKEFSNAAQITGIVLTKLDGTARGGVVLTIKHELGIPVKYVGFGEGLDDLQLFDPQQFTDALFLQGEEQG